MGYELGSQTIFKVKGNDIQTVVNGSFQDDQIVETLDKFINRYIVCSKCTYPEIQMLVKK